MMRCFNNRWISLNKEWRKHHVIFKNIYIFSNNKFLAKYLIDNSQEPQIIQQSFSVSLTSAAGRARQWPAHARSRSPTHAIVARRRVEYTQRAGRPARAGRVGAWSAPPTTSARWLRCATPPPTSTTLNIREVCMQILWVKFQLREIYRNNLLVET